MAIGISVEELYRIFDMTPAEHNIMLVGQHGIGKSRIVADYFAGRGMKVVSLFLGQMSDPGDLIGLPRMNEETEKTEFLPPFWFPTDDVPIVLFLDELNRARPEMLQTVMDLVLNRKLAGRKLPQGSIIVSAVNDGEEYQVGELDPALVSRFDIYHLRPTLQDWVNWAMAAGLDERVIEFIQNNPSMLDSVFDASRNSLDKNPDRRAWERVATAIKDVTEVDEVVTKLIAGKVGTLAASAFIDSLKENRLSGTDILKDFKKSLKKLEALPFERYSILEDNILMTINNLSDVKKFTTTMQRNLGLFLHWLLDNDKREAYAYFINTFLGGSYPQANAFIAQKSPQLIIELTEFIK